MADRKQLKRADHSEIPNDDPFAELTRIMGFDPREPVSRPQPKIIESASIAPSDEDDLSIELEKELIGEFAPVYEEAEAPAAQASSAFAAAPRHVGLARPSDDSLAEDFDLVFDAELAEQPHEPGESDLSDELDAAFASDVLATQPEMTSATDRENAPEAEAEDPREYAEENALAELGEQLEATFEQGLAGREYAEPAAAEFEASADSSEREATGEAYYDAPLIRLGAARDFAHAEESEAPVDMDFLAEAAAEPDEAERMAHATSVEDDDLEAELSALLGRGVLAAPAPPAEAALTPASSSDEAYAEPAAEAPSAEDDVVIEMELEAHGRDEEETAAYEDARSWQDDQPSGHVEYERLEAELAAFDREFESVAASERGSDVHDPVKWDAQTFDQPAYADDPDVESTEEPVEIAATGIADDPVDEQPVTAAGFAPASPPAASDELDDPFAMLAAMVRGTHPINPPDPIAAPASMNEQDAAWSAAPTSNESPTVRTTEYRHPNHSYAHRAPLDVPDIETVDVPEAAVALADDLDIPEVAFDDELSIADFDDFEAELASAFGQHTGGISTPATAEPARVSARETPRDSYHHEFAQPAQPALGTSHAGGALAAAAASATLAAARTTASDSRAADHHHEFDSAGSLAEGHARAAYQVADDEEFDFDPALSEEMAIPSYREAERRPSGRRGMVIAAVVGGLVVIGGIGAFALSSGGVVGSGKPELVRADTDPVKIRPENPGGTTIPNQDNKVFQTMNGTDKGGEPTQKKLISGTEEPVDMAARAEPDASEAAAAADDPIAAEIAAAPKGEERVAAATADETGVNDQVVAVSPRRVRTMVVRADGTLVPSEEPVLSGTEPTTAAETPAGADAAALEPADPAKDLTDPAVAPESTASLTPPAAASAEPEAVVPAESESEAAAPAAAQPDAAATVPATEAAAQKPAIKDGQSTMPATGPVVPSRPADQPVDVVGEVKPQRVASAPAGAATPTQAAAATPTQAAAIPAGAWSVQIASQPSAAAAKSTYEDLARRYGSVIGGRGVNIVKADIAGKGTFWRVRVPAGTRDEAISLCENYKSAGGNCFVSK